MKRKIGWKRKAAVFASCVLAGSMVFTLCACDLFGGRKEDASFPYDGALSSGYTGSEADYMAENGIS